MRPTLFCCRLIQVSLSLTITTADTAGYSDYGPPPLSLNLASLCGAGTGTCLRGGGGLDPNTTAKKPRMFFQAFLESNANLKMFYFKQLIMFTDIMLKFDLHFRK